jgi:hypothetical protein
MVVFNAPTQNYDNYRIIINSCVTGSTNAATGDLVSRAHYFDMNGFSGTKDTYEIKSSHNIDNYKLVKSNDYIAGTGQLLFDVETSYFDTTTIEHTYFFRAEDFTNANVHGVFILNGTQSEIIVADKRARLKKQHKSFHALRGRPSFVDTMNAAEVTALQLLRSLVTPENFRKYLKYGFVTIKGASGLVYNIYRKRHVCVYDGQNEVASLCVHINAGPPTDEVIAKILMCECNEPEIWQRANCTVFSRTQRVNAVDLRKAA